MRMWMAGVIACVLVQVSGVALADSTAYAPHVQSSMVVTGKIVVRPDGRVARYALDGRNKLPAGVRKAVAAAVARWKFQPVQRDGKAVQAKSFMSVQVVANPLGNGQYGISVGDAYFGKPEPGRFITAKDLLLPIVPEQLARRGVTGTAYVVAQVGRTGHVEKAQVWRVDLHIKSIPARMHWWRQKLAQVCLHAAQRWTFKLPTKGPRRNDDHWVVIVPTVFRFKDSKIVPYGRWHTYVPGPVHDIAWLDPRLHISSADAVPTNGGLRSMRQSLHLLAPSGDGG